MQVKSKSFENVGHSSEATEMLKWHDISDVHPNDLKPESSSKEPSKDTMCKSCWSYWILPIIGPIVLEVSCIVTTRGKGNPPEETAWKSESISIGSVS